LIAGAQVVDKTVTDAGSSLTVREVLGDRNNMYLLLNFTAPEGTVLDAYDYRFRLTDLDFEAREGWQGRGCTKLEDADSRDNSLDLVLKVTTDGICPGGTMTMELGELEAAAGYGEPFVSLGLPGTWKVSFPLAYTDCSRTRGGLWTPVELYGQAAVVTEVSVSPLSVAVKGDGRDMGALADAERAAGEDGGFPVTIRFRDGTSCTTNRDAGDGLTYLVGRSSGLSVNWTFHKAIDVAQVEAIEFFGVSIPIG